MTVAVATLGFPRIGLRRELKFALESYWAGKSTLADLQTAAAGLRAGDIISRIGGVARPTAAQVRQAAAGDVPVLVAVERDGRHLVTVLEP